MDETCKTCRFGRMPNQASIQCRRHAPRPVQMGQRMDVPTVPLDFWCGEFEAAPAPAARVTRKAGH